MRQAIITVLLVLLMANQIEVGQAKKKGPGKKGKGKGAKGFGAGSLRCKEKTNVAIEPCWTGYVSCPVDTEIQIDSVNCKEKCTRGKPAGCDDATLQTTIETACNGQQECSVQGVTGATCSELKTVVFVDWSCSATPAAPPS